MVLFVHTCKGKGGTLRLLRSYFTICETAQGLGCCILGTPLPARKVCSPYRGPSGWNILPGLASQAEGRPNVTVLFQSLGQASSPWPLPHFLCFYSMVCPGITSQRKELPLIGGRPPSSFFLKGWDLLGLMAPDMISSQSIINPQAECQWLPRKCPLSHVTTQKMFTVT